MKLDRSNKWPNKCFRCGRQVPAARGFVIPRDELNDPSIPGKGSWLTLCNSRPCAASVVGTAAVEETDQRAILADGRIVLPDDEALKPYKQAIGAWDSDAKCWRASPHRRDRDHVLAVAAALKLDVSPEYAAYEDPAPVRDAVARAKAVPTIRDYQVEGVRWLAYRGIDDAQGCGDVARFNKKDRMRGAVNADSMGLGKTLQTLLALHDDEALVVVCNAAAKAVWPREAKKWRPDRFDKYTTFEGEESFRWPENPRELCIINYDITPYTAAQIEDERAHLRAKYEGHVGDADDKIKWRRKDILGLKIEAARASAKCDRLQARFNPLDTTTGDRHRLYLARIPLAELTDKIKRNEQARGRNAKRSPADKPTCPICLVGDELHYVENHKAKRAQRWRALADKSRRVIGLTGTPAESEPFKLWGLLTSACANPFGWNSFLKQFNAFKSQWDGYEFLRNPPPLGSTAKGSVIVEPGTTEILARSLLRRTKEQVLTELPPRVFSEIPVPISDALRKKLDALAAEYAGELLEGEIPPFGALSATLKLLAKACIPTLESLVESYEITRTPLVVFSANRAPVEALAKRKGWYGILGGTTGKGKIGAIEDAFQAGEGIGVAGTQAAAESMTLTRASTVIQVIPFMARKKNQQAYDRLHRFGQKDTVNVILLVPDHVLVRHILALLIAKDQFVADVLSGYSTPAVQASRFTDESEEAWRARAETKRLADAQRAEGRRVRELKQRERELAKLAEREVTPALSERRAKARAERLGASALAQGVDKRIVADALAHMLARCDGAIEKDNAGFNAPDSAVARWLAPGVRKGSKYAVASAAAILRRYPRQLSGEFAELF